MKGFFFTLIFLTAGIVSTAQVKNNFPQDFVGKWKGTLEWFRTGNAAPQQVNMELNVLPADSPGNYTWNLVYGSASADNRPYLLKSVDSAKVHWIIDELNGIKLDQYWVGNRFTGSFTVQNSTIVNTYYIENGVMIVEFISYASKPIATTGKGNEDAPFVDSYSIKSYQRAVLKKQ